MILRSLQHSLCSSLKVGFTINSLTNFSGAICHFPCNSLFPAIVDDIIDGNLSSVAIAKNLDAFIGNNPPIYTNKSFGVPGIKNNNAITVSIF